MEAMEFMTTQEAAEYLNRSTFTVLRLIERGSLEAQRFGGSKRGPWMITKASVEEYKTRNQGKSPYDPTRH